LQYPVCWTAARGQHLQTEGIGMNRPTSVGLCVLVLLVVIAATAVAQNLPKTYGVYMGGYLIMRIRTGSDELTIGERRQIVQARVTTLLKSTDTRNMDVKVTKTKYGGGYRIVANHVLIITVTPHDAVANGTTVYKQAKVWEKNIRQTFPKAVAPLHKPAPIE
jgi:hypothetical protein